jgi:hypothetical protein
LIHIVMRFFFQLFWLSTKCREQSNILEKQNDKGVCERWMKVFITIIYYYFFILFMKM